MATMLSRGPQVGQKPTNLLPLLQSRVNFNVEFSNALITGQSLVDPSLRRTTLLQTYWLEPEENPVGGGSHHPVWPEDPSGGGERYPSWPEDGGSGGEYFPLALMPEEPSGKGSRALAFPIERPGIEDETDDVTFPQEPIEDDAFPRVALVWTFDGTSPYGVQQLVEAPSFPPEDLGGGAEGPIYCFGGDGRHCPESPGGAGGDYTPTRLPLSGYKLALAGYKRIMTGV